ncbi:chloride intracellular channel protein 3 isoform X1 [Zonotrichia leucophrys gambelii]|uniref:chloride intracellular channel protein 3 isoform X1 n=1 Tax=Zonotrichia leucophrys gambelii TaxID=257770 RepID=UPI00313FE420
MGPGVGGSGCTLRRNVGWEGPWFQLWHLGVQQYSSSRRAAWPKNPKSSSSSRALDVLKDFAPGAQLPVLLYNGEPKTDTITIEEFLEDQLSPPLCPSLVPQYPESSLAGNDIFHKFSAFIKNPVPAQDEALQRSLLRALLKLDEYLSAPLEHELAQDPHLRVSQRHFLDGDHLTLADCNLLPKLNIVQVVCQHYRHFGIPKDLRGVWRYLNSASETKEFKYTCPNSQEIIQAYRSVVRAPQ